MMLLGKIALGFAGVAVAGAGVLCSEGIITVNVVEKQPEQHHIFVAAPALLGPIGMHFAPRHSLQQAARELRPWLPTVRVALEELRRSEDMTFVEVRSAGEHVKVVKSGGAIVVDVNDPENAVHVSAPIRALRSTIEELAVFEPAN
jgi:hypothetical protein